MGVTKPLKPSKGQSKTAHENLFDVICYDYLTIHMDFIQ